MTARACDICGITETEVPLDEGHWGVFCDRDECEPSANYTPRRRHYAELTPEVLDRLELEADKYDYQCEVFGVREISGPELHALIRLARHAMAPLVLGNLRKMDLDDF